MGDGDGKVSRAGEKEGQRSIEEKDQRAKANLGQERTTRTTRTTRTSRIRTTAGIDSDAGAGPSARALGWQSNSPSVSLSHLISPISLDSD